VRQDFDIKRVSTKELWRLMDLTLAEIGSELGPTLQSAGLRRALRRALALESELKLRGVQLELDLRQREQVPAHGHIDR
jgi:hypothetical protein